MNRSKMNDPRFIKKWRESGAIKKPKKIPFEKIIKMFDLENLSDWARAAVSPEMLEQEKPLQVITGGFESQKGYFDNGGTVLTPFS